MGKSGKPDDILKISLRIFPKDSYVFNLISILHMGVFQGPLRFLLRY